MLAWLVAAGGCWWLLLDVVAAVVVGGVVVVGVVVVVRVFFFLATAVPNFLFRTRTHIMGSCQLHDDLSHHNFYFA